MGHVGGSGLADGRLKGGVASAAEARVRAIAAGAMGAPPA